LGRTENSEGVMTEREYEGRIMELEHALEDVLECFEISGNSYTIDTDLWDDAQVDLDIADIISAAADVLYGGPNYAEEE
jgi:hypothetical protein